MIEELEESYSRSDDKVSSYEDRVYDSYDKDGEEELGGDNLEKKAQEFIDMMNSFWREELVYDRFDL